MFFYVFIVLFGCCGTMIEGRIMFECRNQNCTACALRPTPTELATTIMCPTDSSLWSTKEGCDSDCPEEPDCYYCDVTTRTCKGALGLACPRGARNMYWNGTECETQCSEGLTFPPLLPPAPVTRTPTLLPVTKSPIGDVIRSSRYHCARDTCEKCGIFCPTDMPNWKTAEECSAKCPLEPDCYHCSKECTPWFGLACGNREISVRTLDECKKSCPRQRAPIPSFNPSRTQYSCQGTKCVPCSGPTCPLDSPRYNTESDCTKKCPSKPCFSCVGGSCRPLFDFACEIAGSKTFTTAEECAGKCFNLTLPPVFPPPVSYICENAQCKKCTTRINEQCIHHGVIYPSFGTCASGCNGNLPSLDFDTEYFTCREPETCRSCYLNGFNTCPVDNRFAQLSDCATACNDTSVVEPNRPSELHMCDPFTETCRVCYSYGINSCPADGAAWPDADDCEKNCPPKPDCYLCGFDQTCRPAIGLGCYGSVPTAPTLDGCESICNSTLVPDDLVEILKNLTKPDVPLYQCSQSESRCTVCYSSSTTNSSNRTICDDLSRVFLDKPSCAIECSRPTLRVLHQCDSQTETCAMCTTDYIPDGKIRPCVADGSAYKKKSDCDADCPESPNCHMCTPEGKCVPGFGYACVVTPLQQFSNSSECDSLCGTTPFLGLPNRAPPGSPPSDECAKRTLNNCDKNAQCVDVPEGYLCLCKPGYHDTYKTTGLPTGRNCKLVDDLVSQVTNATLLYTCDSRTDKCVVCTPDFTLDGHVRECVADGSAYRNSSDCESNCPPEPECYFCGSDQTCEPAFGIACFENREVTSYSTMSDCASVCQIAPQAAPAMNEPLYVCDGDSCRSCNVDPNSHNSCPVDVGLWNTMTQCQNDCPPKPDCFFCENGSTCRGYSGLTCWSQSPDKLKDIYSTSGECVSKCIASPTQPTTTPEPKCAVSFKLSKNTIKSTIWGASSAVSAKDCAKQCYSNPFCQSATFTPESVSELGENSVKNGKCRFSFKQSDCVGERISDYVAIKETVDIGCVQCSG